jgi:hypothetical protein
LLPFSIGNGLPQAQRPLVQAFTVAPVLNPDILSIKRLAKNDFPLRYGPVKATIESLILNILIINYFFFVQLY